jgi:hypothetical protein
MTVMTVRTAGISHLIQYSISKILSPHKIKEMLLKNFQKIISDFSSSVFLGGYGASFRKIRPMTCFKGIVS